MKKLLLFLSLFFSLGAHAAEMANVEYIHKVVEQQWGITIPYNPALENPKVAANMKYLLTVVDRANKVLNREAITDYGNGEYATLYAADTIATNDASDRLIKIEPKFFITTTADTEEFSFSMSAKGTFQIDWGDGNKQRIIRPTAGTATYTHTYDTADKYEIGIGGLSMAYASSIPAISFADNKNVAGISGSLGAVFPTIGDGSARGQQPIFSATFNNCTNLTSEIPENLFKGLHGAPIKGMFEYTFQDSRVSGKIPANLFADLEGEPQNDIFYSTFFHCSGLSGEIPANLFAGIKGKPTSSLFYRTFSGTGVSAIPETLFAGIKGEPAQAMFSNTFANCRNLTKIPEGLFSGIEGEPAQAMFTSTFSGCAGLTEIPEGLFSGIKGPPATSMFSNTFSQLGKLSKIPAGLFSGIEGPPATGMFNNTFWYTGVPEIPAGLFSNIKGPAAPKMFAGTFSYCGLTKIPDGLFAGIEGPPAEGMFDGTFYWNPYLSEIPVGLFCDLKGPAATNMFTNTFYNCAGATGPSAQIDGTPLYDIWPDATEEQVGGCYKSAEKLSDYADIPDVWK